MNTGNIGLYVEFLSVYRSPEWQYIPEEEKQEIGLTFDDDGEFWYYQLIFLLKK